MSRMGEGTETGKLFLLELSFSAPFPLTIERKRPRPGCPITGRGLVQCPLPWGSSSRRPLALGPEGCGLRPGSLGGGHHASLTPRPRTEGKAPHRR